MFVALAPDLIRLLRYIPAARGGFQAGLIPIRFLTNSQEYEYVKDGTYSLLPHNISEVTGFAIAVACRMVAGGLAEYY